MALNKKRRYVAHYTSAGAFAQTRLDKYLQQNFGSFGGAPFVLPSIGFGGPPADDLTTIETKALLHDTTGGLIYSLTLAELDPTWVQWNSGLTEDQYQSINHIEICPNGSVYAGFCAADDLGIFLAKSPYVGGAFTVVEDYDSINAKCGSPAALVRFGSFAVNPLLPEQVVCAYNISGIDEMHMYIGSGTTWTAGAIFTTPWNCSISYYAGIWLLTSAGNYFRLNADVSATLASGTLFSYLVTAHSRCNATGKTLHYGDGGLYVSTDNLVSYTTVHTPPDFSSIADLTPDGALIMSPDGYKSSDSGSSFSFIPDLPAPQTWAAAYAGGLGSSSRWLAASNGGYIFLTEDFWTSVLDKRGNLLDLISIPHLDIVKMFA